MTREEAIKEIKGFYDECRNDDEIELIYKNAFAMAIRSLEAWKKVKEEIEKAKYLKYGQEYGATNCLASGLDKALEIIDKHLKEVENGFDKQTGGQ